eukprot:UN20059
MVITRLAAENSTLSDEVSSLTEKLKQHEAVNALSTKKHEQLRSNLARQSSTRTEVSQLQNELSNR